MRALPVRRAGESPFSGGADRGACGPRVDCGPSGAGSSAGRALPSHGRGPGFESPPVQGTMRQAAWGPLAVSQGLAAPRRRGQAALASPRHLGEPPGILAGCRLRAESRRRRSTTIRFQRIASQHHPCAVAPSGCHSTREHGASGSLARKPWSKRGHRGCAGLPSHGGLAAQWRMDPSCGPDGETDEPPSPALPGWREDLGAAPIPRYGARGFRGAEGPASAAAIGGRRRGRRRPPADPIPPPPTGVARPPRAGGAAPGPRCRPPPPLKPPIWGTVGA